MLKNKNIKFIVGVFVALLVLIATSIWVVSSMQKNEVDEFGYNNLAVTSDAATSLTQIDHIIQNSYNTENGNDNLYHVAIIYPDTAPVEDAVVNFFADGQMKQYVINNYRTIDELMADDMIDVKTYSVSNLNSLTADEIATELGKADMIYLYSTSTENLAYVGTNAISEDLYSCLHNYAFGANKPLIINYYMNNNGGESDVIPSGSDVANTNIYALTASDFKNSWRNTDTLNVSGWVDGVTEDALIKTDATGATGILSDFVQSIRSGYNEYSIEYDDCPAGYDSWEAYWKRLNPDGAATLNILYLHDGSPDANVNTIEAFGKWMIGDGSQYAFTGNMENLPKEVHVDSVAVSDVARDTFYAIDNVKKYDYIMLAPGTDYNTASMDLGEDARKILNDLSIDRTSPTYILFGTLDAGNTDTDNTDESENLIIDTTTNYGKLVDLSITTTGYAKKNNILVVGTEFIQTIAADPTNNQVKVAQIASLINKSTFRSHAGSGSVSGSVSTTTYRVLELQPCYPIDKELAVTQTDIVTNLSKYTSSAGLYSAAVPVGNYYTIPANVLNTSEIDNYMTDDGKVTQEYYQWDLSKAKVAYALGMQADQIELVQMSTDEYITAKTDVSDSFDLIYIGGNMSAFKNHNAYGFAPNWGSKAEWREYEAVFSMYCHTGELTDINGSRLTTNNPYKYTLMNGNDITYDRLTQLKEYIDAGMPIAFSNEVWNAYELAVAQGYKNRYMDPDCNMFELCKYAEQAQKNGKTSVLTNWQIRQDYTGSTDEFFDDYYVANGEIRIDNSDGCYGSASKVTVYNDDLSDELYRCVYSNTTSVRPKFVIDTNAVAYVEGDSSTELTKRDVSWSIQLLNPIEGHTYQAVLLEDVNDNAVFELRTSEVLKTADFVDGIADITYTYSVDDFGAFSWKILVQDTTTNTAGGYSAITCFAKLDYHDKKTASILEIMPMTVANCNSGSPSTPDGHTFYLDTNYQQSSGNPYLYSSYGTAEASNYGYCPIIHNNSNYGSDELNYNSNLVARATDDGNYQGLTDMNMGKYMTTLSINRYDSAAGHEDRNYNYMDLVADEYDFSLDIMYMDDIEYYAKVARNSTEEERAEYLKLAEEALTLYEAYETEGTDEYNQLKAVEDELRKALISIQDGNGYTATCSNGVTYSYPSSDYVTYDIDGMLETRNYFRFFYLNDDVYHSFTGGAGDYCQSAALVYFGAYQPYIEVHDKMVDAYRKYRHYSMMAYGPDEYLRKNYDVIVVGFLDDYAGDFTDFSQDATDDLLAFTNYTDPDGTVGPGNLLMTHDNMTYSYAENHAKVLTENMRSVMGMAPYSNLTAQGGTEDTAYSKYSSLDVNRYFLTNLSSDENYDLSMHSRASSDVWNTTVNEWFTKTNKANWDGKNKLNLQGYTDVFNVYETNTGKTLRYTYAEFQIERAIEYNIQIESPLRATGTAKATQVNRGVVTTYPFYIASDLRISPTHSQAFALDLEDQDVTVWYTLAADSTEGAGSAGGTNYSLMKENSSFYAASPKDGMDSYYIYSVGNITYCGAGHALITGDERDNNDERRLFLNVLINLASKSQPEPVVERGIVLYDPDGTTKAPGNVVKHDIVADEYYIDVNSRIAYPEFGFAVSDINSDKAYTKSISRVEIFYDLDYGVGANPTLDYLYTKNVDQHICDLTYAEVADLTAEKEKALTDAERAKRQAQIQANTVIESLRAGNVQIIDQFNFPSLTTQLKAENGSYLDYFEPYGGEYTYIVIRVTSKVNGIDSVITKRIKVNLTKDLLDLT